MQSPKAKKLKLIVAGEFRKSQQISDPIQIDALKSNAMRALSNYLMLESGLKDKRFQDRMSKYTRSEKESIQNVNSQSREPLS